MLKISKDLSVAEVKVEKLFSEGGKARFVDEPAVRDGNLITARAPDDLPEFCRLIMEEKNRRESQRFIRTRY